MDAVLGAPSARPRFKPAESLLSYTIPNLSQRRFKMQHKAVHSTRRRDARAVFRAWRRQAALQIDIRNKSKMMAVVITVVCFVGEESLATCPVPRCERAPPLFCRRSS